MGLKIGDVMERTKCGAEGWRRNGRNKVWGLRLATQLKEQSVGLKVGDGMERTKCGAEGW